MRNAKPFALILLASATVSAQTDPHSGSAACAPEARSRSVRYGLALQLAQQEGIGMDAALAQTPTPHNCSCSGMVARVQQPYFDAYEAERRSCWTRFAPGLPALGPESRMAQLFTPPGVAQCIKAINWSVPSHCDVIASGNAAWEGKGITGLAPAVNGSRAYNQCAKSCLPEKCLCPDTVCAPHSWDTGQDPYRERFDKLPEVE